MSAVSQKRTLESWSKSAFFNTFGWQRPQQQGGSAAALER